MPSANKVIIAAAGARKTEYVVTTALANPDERTLIVTYTNENQREIISRIQQKTGVVPRNIRVMGWFTFLVNECARPFQRSVFGKPNHLRNLNFIGSKPDYVAKTSTSYFFDGNRDIYRDGVSDFAVIANTKTGGAVIRRLEAAYDHILIDEVQDLTGFDLDILDLILRSRIQVTAVGDPRQFMLRTTNVTKNKKYCGLGLISWFEERQSICSVEEQSYSYRCKQDICDFADSLFPEMTPTESRSEDHHDHTGIFVIKASEMAEYMKMHSPTILTYDKNKDTQGHPSMNIGKSKGSTHDHVLIIPSGPMLKYVKDRDLSKFKEPEKLYVAVTRARYSAAFVDPSK